MDMKIFKRNLDAYGADFSRWKNVDTRDAESFMRTSPEAKKIYEQTQKLDVALNRFTTDLADQSIMENVKKRITGDNVTAFPLSRKPRLFPRNKMIGGGLAVAAAVVLFVSVVTKSDESYAPVREETKMAAAPVQIDSFVSEMTAWMDEDYQAEAVLGLLEVAQAVPPPDVDAFLDSLFAEPKEDPDIWNAFVPQENTK